MPEGLEHHIEVFDISGKRLYAASGRGAHHYVFDGKIPDVNHDLASGTYFVRATAGNKSLKSPLVIHK